MSKPTKTETQARLAKEKAERDAKMAAQKADRLEAKKPALPNRRPLSAIEADITATQTDDTANLIKRGEYLIEAKEQIEHGDWTRWLSHNFDLSERTAQSQMQVARFVAGLGKNETIAVLNLSKSALYKMSHGDYPYRADYIPAILQEAGKRFLTPRGVDRFIFKYREEHKTPEEREAERLATEERRDLIAKADLQWVPDDDDGDLKVETPKYIYKIVPQGEDDDDNKIFELQRFWKGGSKYVPLTAHEGAVPLDVAKAFCAKDVIEEAAQKTEGPETSEPASGGADESETSDAVAPEGEKAEPPPVTARPAQGERDIEDIKAKGAALDQDAPTTAPASAADDDKSDDDHSLAKKLFDAFNEAFLLCLDQNNWLHLSNNKKDKDEFRSAMKRLENLREVLPRLARPRPAVQ